MSRGLDKKGSKSKTLWSHLGVEPDPLLLLLPAEVEPLKDSEHLLHPLVGVPEADGWDPGTGVAENPLLHFPVVKVELS